MVQRFMHRIIGFVAWSTSAATIVLAPRQFDTLSLMPPCSISLSRCAQGREPMKSQQLQKTKRQATKQQHSKAEPEQPEKSKSTASRDYAITWVQSQYCICAQTFLPPSIVPKWRGLRELVLLRHPRAAGVHGLLFPVRVGDLEKARRASQNDTF